MKWFVLNAGGLRDGSDDFLVARGRLRLHFLGVVSPAERQVVISNVSNVWRVPLGIFTACAVIIGLVAFAFFILPVVFIVDFWKEINETQE